MNGTELRGFSQFEILTWIAYSDISRNPKNWLILKFLFIHCKTVKVSHSDQIPTETLFRSVFLMKGTELRSFSHFQILTKIPYPDLRRKLDNWLILEFYFIYFSNCESQSKRSNSNVNLIYKCFLDEWRRIKKI